MRWFASIDLTGWRIANYCKNYYVFFYFTFSSLKQDNFDAFTYENFVEYSQNKRANANKLLLPIGQQQQPVAINYLPAGIVERLGLIQGDGDTFVDILSLIGDYEGKLKKKTTPPHPYNRIIILFNPFFSFPSH